MPKSAVRTHRRNSLSDPGRTDAFGRRVTSTALGVAPTPPFALRDAVPEPEPVRHWLGAAPADCRIERPSGAGTEGLPGAGSSFAGRESHDDERYRIAVGPLAGQRTMRLRVPTPGESLPPTPGALTANHDGFSLNAAVACGATMRKKLERLCHYMARGPLPNERLSIDGDGLVVHELKRPFRDGTTQCL